MRSRNLTTSQWRLDALEGRVLLSGLHEGERVDEVGTIAVLPSPTVQWRRPMVPMAKAGRVAGAQPPGAGNGNGNGGAGAGLVVPALNSFPSATAMLFLDFDGEAGGPWGTYTTTPTPAFDLDGNASGFGVAESAAIQEIWERVAEKYSPFRLNVTTVDPGVYNDRAALRVVIGGDGAWTNQTPLPGGFGYVGGFTNSAPNTVWVFAANFFGRAANVAEAAAHEAGHGFGLEHQSLWSGTTKLNEYNRGNSLRAPIMGTSYSAARGMWWNGATSNGYDQIQDDISLLAGVANGFGFRQDDHAQVRASATPLAVTGDSFSGSGVIERVEDSDLFRFMLPSYAAVTFNVSVAAKGAMLDSVLRLFDTAGAQSHEVKTSSLGETISVELGAGTYWLAVASQGGYGDIGQYRISGSFTAVTLPVAAPTTLAAQAISPTQVKLTWVDQSSNETGFRIERSADGGANWGLAGEAAAGAQEFTDPAAAAGSALMYRVYAVSAENRSVESNVVSVVTPGTGEGLRGEYLDLVDLTGLGVPRTDGALDFDWQVAALPEGVLNDGTFSVRWTGRVQALDGGEYRFFTTADDGVRVWVDGQLLIDRWTDNPAPGDANGDGTVDSADFAVLRANYGTAGGWDKGDFNGDGRVSFADFQVLERSFGSTTSPVEDAGAITLAPAGVYDVMVEYYQNGGPGSVKLEWQPPGREREVVPVSQLYVPAAPAAPAGEAVATVAPSTARTPFSTARVVRPKAKPIRLGGVSVLA